MSIPYQITIAYPLGRLRNFVGKEDDGSNEHFYTENRGRALKFPTIEAATTYIENHKWLRDMRNDGLIKILEDT